MKKIKSFIFKVGFYPFKILISLYWFLWRENQLSNFKHVGNNVWIGRNCFFHAKNISIGNDVFSVNIAAYKQQGVIFT